eukprot:COSAG01_NODE_10379_length_2181_cov_16.647454_1_plen_87_part_10
MLPRVSWRGAAANTCVTESALRHPRPVVSDRLISSRDHFGPRPWMRYQRVPGERPSCLSNLANVESAALPSLLQTRGMAQPPHSAPP